MRLETWLSSTVVALAQDMGSIPSTHKAVYNHVQLLSHALLWPPWTLHEHGAQTYQRCPGGRVLFGTLRKTEVATKNSFEENLPSLNASGTALLGSKLLECLPAVLPTILLSVY